MPDTFCNQCGQPLADDPPGVAPENRAPCPNCGSRSRRYEMHAESGVFAVTGADPVREMLLRRDTHKGDVDEVGRRVYYTLTEKTGTSGHRTAKCLSLLIELMHKKGLLSEQELDDLLLEATS